MGFKLIPAALITGLIAGTQILPGTITAGLLANGIVVAGIVDGTLILGARIIADGSSGDFLVYSGTPALGDLIASVSPIAGTDGPGNAFVPGIAGYDSAGNPSTLTGPGLITEFGGHQVGSLAYTNAGLTPAYYLHAGSPFASLMADPLHAVDPGNASTPETEHTVTTGFPAGWTGTVSYRLLAEFGLVMLWAEWSIAPTTVITHAEVLLASIPAAYRPANVAAMTLWIDNQATWTGQPVDVGSAGGINYEGAGITIGAAAAPAYMHSIYSVNQ